MSTVIFHWITPKGFESPHAKKKILARWCLTCKAFGIIDLICVSNEPMHISDAEINFTNVKTFNDAFDMVVGTFVLVEQGHSDLRNFKHPEDAIYIFGSDYQGLEKNLDKINVSINSLLPLHAEIAAGIVLESRGVQWPLQ